MNEDAKRDPGQYLGRKPERASESIPGGARPDDERVAAQRESGPPPESEPGRPTGPTNEHGLRPGVAHETAETEAPEEHGEQPATEHAPGGDL